MVRIDVNSKAGFGFLFFVFWAKVGVDEGADKPA